jgi:hypothetical protein
VVHIGFCWGDLTEDHLEDPGVDGRIIRINTDLQEAAWEHGLD